MPPGRWQVPDGAERAEPFPQPRPAGMDDDEGVGSAGGVDVEDLGEGEQLAAYVVDVLAAVGDVDLVGVHGVLPGMNDNYYGS